jgi:hypothetical protein
MKGGNSMKLPKLSATEKAKIRSIKKEANQKIANMRAKAKAENQHKFTNVTGMPVRLIIDEQVIIIDYDLVNKFLKKIPIPAFSVLYRIHQYGCLQIEYWKRFDDTFKGCVEFYDPPAYKKALLNDLPIIGLIDG